MDASKIRNEDNSGLGMLIRLLAIPLPLNIDCNREEGGDVLKKLSYSSIND